MALGQSAMDCGVAQESPTARIAGTVQPAQRVVVKARVDGRVARVLVDVGSAVRAMIPLVQMSAPELTAELAAQEARIAEAEQRTQILTIKRQHAMARVERAEAQRQTLHDATLIAKAQVESQEQITRTREQLAEAGRVSKAEAFQSRQLLFELQRRLSRAKLSEAAADNATEDHRREAELFALEKAAHQSRIAVLRSERDALQATVDMLKVKCPLEHATVNRVFVSQGDVVRASDTSICELIDLRRMRVEFSLTAEQVRRSGKGAKVRVTAATGALDAVIQHVSYGHGGAGRALATVMIDNEDGKWLPGESVVIELELAK